MVVLPELGQQPRHEVLGRAHHADGQRADLQALQPRGRILGFLQGGQHAARVHQHVFARRGERHLPPVALEQRHAHMPFELLDLHRHRRRREVKRLRRFGKAEVSGHFAEHPQLPEGGVLHGALPRCGCKRKDKPRCMPVSIVGARHSGITEGRSTVASSAAF